MPNTREKLIELLQGCICDYVSTESYDWWVTYEVKYEELADHLIANGVIFDKDINVPTECQNCTHHDTYTCPENKVWCKMLRRYMSLDGYCSFGERKNDEKLV